MHEIQFFIRDWFRANTFTPRWFPAAVRHPVSAFGFGILIQSVAILCTTVILNLVPDFSFRGALIIVGVVITALTVGGGPGLIASFTGTLLLQFFLLPPYFSFSLNKGSDTLSVVFYLFVCLSTNLAASHVEQIHRRTRENEHQGAFSPGQTVPSRLDAMERRVSVTEEQLTQLAQSVARQSEELRTTITESQHIILAKIAELPRQAVKSLSEVNKIPGG